ncbi:MAG TPA: hypothetical protein VJ782_02285 [Aeromicrobium sp.]|nr:hypothetical protein [Aeromicrobium sp.]
MNTSEILNKAADLIEEQEGWTSGSGWPGEAEYGGSETGGLCLEGGIMAALGIKFGQRWDDTFKTCPAVHAVNAYLERPAGHALYGWNDMPGRTADEVVEVLRAAAVIEAAREEQDAAWATYAEQVSA